MKSTFSFLFVLMSLSLTSQIEIPNIGIIVIEDIPETQQFTLEVTNTSTESIDLEWEVEKMEGVADFLDISISDINLDYTPSVLTTCDLDWVENVLEGGTFYPMGLRAIVGNVPQGIDRDSILAYFHIYEVDACDEAPLASIAITFNPLLDALGTPGKEDFNLYPNPSSHFIQIAYEGELSGQEFQVYDLHSKLLIQQKFDSNSIDISQLPSGGYILKYKSISKLFFVAN